MSEELQLTIPDAEAPETAVAAFAVEQMNLLNIDADEARYRANAAFERGWSIGKALVPVGDRMGQEGFEKWVKENIQENYFPIYRWTMLAIMNPERPPLRTVQRWKQVEIALENEPEPKDTPRKPGAQKLVNFKACTSGIQRWWRGGDAIEGLDAETLKEIAEDLQPVVAIAQAVNVALTKAQ